MNKIQNFEEIIPTSNLLEEEMEALRGGTNTSSVECGGGKIISCNIGKDVIADAKINAA